MRTLLNYLLMPWLKALLLLDYLFPLIIACEPQLEDSKEVEKQFAPLSQKPLSFTFPDKFILRDLVAITAPVFELKTNPLQDKANVSMREWFLT